MVSTTGIGSSPATPDQIANLSTNFEAASARCSGVSAMASLLSELTDSVAWSAMADPFSSSPGPSPPLGQFALIYQRNSRGFAKPIMQGCRCQAFDILGSCRNSIAGKRDEMSAVQIDSVQV